VRLCVEGVTGLPEVRPGDDLAALLTAACPDLQDGDVVVVTSKVVSKAEGRVRPVARSGDRDEAVAAETRRVVASWTTPRGTTSVVATRHGFVMAAAGVDASNTEPGTVVLLPEDPDESARRLRRGLADRLGVQVAVVVSDTFGRPWRVGQTDLAVGAAGIDVVDDLRGRHDGFGNALGVTVVAVADELAAAADLVKGKLSGVPAAVVRGLGHLVTADDGPGARALVRPVEEDMFSLGTREALALGRAEGRRDAVAALREALRSGATVDEAMLQAVQAEGEADAASADRADHIAR
jgi:coenzyme F420-0:L-glutamate ligase/coenzyme F420-1:gamma-L-glutamate ligase